MHKLKHRLVYRRSDATIPEDWAYWFARDTRGFVFASMEKSGGLLYRDERRTPVQTWHIADAERFPACATIDEFKRRLRAYFALWGGREGPQLPPQRKAATMQYKKED